MDNGLIGSVINALPIDKMILCAVAGNDRSANSAAKSYADFLLQVCIQNGKAVAVQFDYDETIVDEKGCRKARSRRRCAFRCCARSCIR